jgi:hypothetical protein
MAIGFAQGIIGGFAAAFAYVLYYNFFGIQTVLNVPQQDVLLYMLVLIVFGILSIISGLFLVNER